LEDARRNKAAKRNEQQATLGDIAYWYGGRSSGQLAWLQIPGGYRGYSPSKNFSEAAKYCISPPQNDEIASLP